LGIIQATLNNQSLCEELIDIYFDVIHYKQHLLFHRASFVLDHEASIIPRYLVLGIITLSARCAPQSIRRLFLTYSRFSSHPSFSPISPWDRGEPFFREAIRSFDQQKKLISIESLQGCILLAFCALTIGDPDRDALLSCQAIRITQALKLPGTLTSNGLIREVEINRTFP
jgi:alpha-L-rhamnosidase